MRKLQIGRLKEIDEKKRQKFSELIFSFSLRLSLFLAEARCAVFIMK